MKTTRLINRFLYFITGNLNFIRKDGYVVKSKRQRLSDALKVRIFERDNHTCHYCKRKFNKKHLTIDHFIPHSVSQDDSEENLVSACQKCNQLKKNINPENKKHKKMWNAFLLTAPKVKVKPIIIQELMKDKERLLLLGKIRICDFFKAIMDISNDFDYKKNIPISKSVRKLNLTSEFIADHASLSTIKHGIVTVQSLREIYEQ